MLRKLMCELREDGSLAKLPLGKDAYFMIEEFDGRYFWPEMKSIKTKGRFSTKRAERKARLGVVRLRSIAMAVDWEGATKLGSWSRTGFSAMKWMILLGALRVSSGSSRGDAFDNIEDLADFGEHQKSELLQLLAECDPVRMFLLKPGQGRLSTQETSALAKRLAEIICFLGRKRIEDEKFIYLPHMVKRRNFLDNQLNLVALLMYECAAATEQGIEINWDDC